MFQHVTRTAPGDVGRGYDNVAGIFMFFGKLGSAVVSSDFGALGESESARAFLRDFLAPFFCATDDAESVAFRFGFAGDGEADATLATSWLAANVAVRLEERRVAILR